MSSVTLPRPAERVAIFSLLLVFLCGGVAGAMVMSFWFHPHHPPRSPATGITMSIDEWKQKLDLSNDQTRQLNSVLDDLSLYYDNVLAYGNSRVMQILNPAQKLRYQQMLLEHKK